MSRAFVKELDGDQADDDVIERPQSEHPNYITSTGLKSLKDNLEVLRKLYRELKLNEDELASKNRLKKIEADLRYLEKRIQCAIPVDVTSQTATDIRFGATVNLLDENAQQCSFTIVGEDEADPERGLLSWVSPLARELIGKQKGDVVVWKKPSGDQEMEIMDFEYIQEHTE